MTQPSETELKKNIIAVGHLLWEKDLASGLNGNISVRAGEEVLLCTAHGTCLGILKDTDILTLGLDGIVKGKGAVSTEKLLHTEIYKSFPETQAVVHTHTTFTNAYFLENDVLDPKIFESKLFLGRVSAVPQSTPAVTDAAPVIDALKANNIVVLKNHGTVAMGKDLFDCFLLIQALEDAVKIDAIRRLYAKGDTLELVEQRTENSASNGKFKLFSQEQIDRIVEIVNDDPQMAELGAKTNMTFDLAVTLNETGTSYCFSFIKGRIERVANDANGEFVVSAPEKVWRAVFNREIDPFVATTQKKMKLDGDFAKISKWYAPCSRVFELWQQVPVE